MTEQEEFKLRQDDRIEATEIELAIIQAIPAGCKHVNIILALNRLIATHVGYLREEDYEE